MARGGGVLGRDGSRGEGGVEGGDALLEGGEDGAGVGGAEGGELAGVLQEDADVGVVGGAPAEGGDGGGGGGELFLLLWGHGVVLLGCEDGEGGHPGRPRFARAGGAAPMAVRSVGDGAAEGAAAVGER